MRALLHKIFILLTWPLYRLWKRGMLREVNQATPLVGFPLMVFMNLELDQVYLNNGWQAAQDACLAKLEDIQTGWELTFDAMADPSLATDLVELPPISWIKINPQVVRPLQKCRWFADGDKLYLSVKELIDQAPSAMLAALDLKWEGFCRRRVQSREMEIVPDEQKRIDRERGLYRALGGRTSSPNLKPQALDVERS
jgi:hypothetical protein